MKCIIIGVVTLVGTLLISKLFIAVDLVNYDDLQVTHKQRENRISQKELEKTGKSIYLIYCASCHGSDGKGNNGKSQDHTKRIAKKSVLDVIDNGSNNFKSLYPSGMPSGLLNKKDAQEMGQYITNGMGGDKPKSWAICATCHDTNGEGIPFIAPNIKAYSDALVHTVLTNGKKGVLGRMPSFKGRFTDYQMKAVAEHIRSLSKIHLQKK